VSNNNSILNFHIPIFSAHAAQGIYAITNLALFIGGKLRSASPCVHDRGVRNRWSTRSIKRVRPGSTGHAGAEKCTACHVSHVRIGLRFLSRHRPLSTSCRRCNDPYWPWDCRHMRWNSPSDKKHSASERAQCIALEGATRGDAGWKGM